MVSSGPPRGGAGNGIQHAARGELAEVAITESGVTERPLRARRVRVHAAPHALPHGAPQGRAGGGESDPYRSS